MAFLILAILYRAHRCNKCPLHPLCLCPPAARWLIGETAVLLCLVLGSLTLTATQWYIFDTNFNGWGHVPFESPDWDISMFEQIVGHTIFASLWLGGFGWSIVLAAKILFMSEKEILKTFRVRR